MPKPFEVGKTYKTVNGNTARVLATNAKGVYPLIVLFRKSYEYPVGLTINGTADGFHDLIPESETQTLYIAEFENDGVVWFKVYTYSSIVESYLKKIHEVTITR